MPHPFHNGPECPLQTSTVRSCVLEEPNLLIESRRDVNAIKRHGRAILTEEQAQIIFRHKPTAFSQDRDKAGVLARRFGVSIKTVRDVWVGRTWYRATFHMDRTKPFEPERLEKKAGRPKGAKDSKPRSRKHQADGAPTERLPESVDQACLETCEPLRDGGVWRASDLMPTIQIKPAGPRRENADPRSWMDFPTAIPSGGFDDPFREDWAIALQCNRQSMESSSYADGGFGEDGAI